MWSLLTNASSEHPSGLHPNNTMPYRSAESGLSFVQLAAMLKARKKTIGLVTLLTITATFALTQALPRSYTASADLFIDYRASDPINGRQFHPMLDESYMQTQIDIIKSDEIANHVITATGMLSMDSFRRTVEQQGEARARSGLIKSVGKDLEVIVRKSSRVVELRYSAHSPELARDALNAAIKGYMQMATNISTAPAKTRQEQYNIQLQSLRQEMDRIQQVATEYQQKHQIIESEERYDNSSHQLNEMSSKLLGVQAQRNEALARKRVIQNMVKSGVPAEEVPEIAQLRGITELKLRLAELEGKIAEMSGVLGESHPKLKAVQSERNVLRERLDREAQTALNALLADDSRFSQHADSLQGQFQAQQRQVLEMKRHRDVLGSYQRQLDSVRSIYNSAIQKYDEILMASSVNSPSLAVLRWAEAPFSHSKPILRTNLLMSLPSGLLLGLCLAFVAEMAIRRVRCLDDMQREFDIPVLGHTA